MKIIKNDKLIKRNGKIGQWMSLGALAVLGAGMYISFAMPELFAYSVGALLLGFTMTQIGMYMGNRWGRSPRPDEKLDAGLKGLPGDYSIYHYITPASHLLVGPAGLWVLMPYHQRGKIAYRKNRWRNSGGGFVQGYMRLFGQEGLGRPDVELDSEIQSVKKFLGQHFDESEIPEIQAAMVFTSDTVEIEANDAPVPALKSKQLKEHLRQAAKSRALPQEKIRKINEVLPKEK
jgi:hypothetical protein